MRVLLLALLVALFLPAGMMAQIPPRKTVALASAGGSPRVVVGTPFISGDAGPAIRIGQALRDRLSRLMGAKYQVVSRESLNGLLVASGYGPDAPLADAMARALASQFKATLVVSATVVPEADGRLTVTASLAPPSDASPPQVTVTQSEGQSLEALGSAVAERLRDGGG